MPAGVPASSTKLATMPLKFERVAAVPSWRAGSANATVIAYAVFGVYRPSASSAGWLDTTSSSWPRERSWHAVQSQPRSRTEPE